jgi:hypothetical protein
MKAPPCFDDPETKKMIRSICDKHKLDAELLKDICELVLDHSGSGRRFGLDDELASIVNRFLSRSAE